jgi:peptide/nickel transport system permease protein
VLSRIFYGARISLTIGLLGIVISFVLGLVFGGIAGYFRRDRGHADPARDRDHPLVPELPLWMALSAVLPVTWSPLLVYFGITGILALLDWTGLARAVRSKLLALREEDYCTAARLMGASPKRIITRHLLPGFMSHLIAAASLSIRA